MSAIPTRDLREPEPPKPPAPIGPLTLAGVLLVLVVVVGVAWGTMGAEKAACLLALGGSLISADGILGARP